MEDVVIKKFLTFLAATAFLVAGVTASQADHDIYENYGGWYYDDNPGGYEYIILGFGNGWGMAYEGTELYCVQQGVGYATMRRVMRDSTYYGRWVNWWVANSCSGGYERICIDNGRETRCSTYQLVGDRRLDE